MGTGDFSPKFEKTLRKVARFSSSESVKEKKSRFQLGKFLYIGLTEFRLWIDFEPVWITDFKLYHSVFITVFSKHVGLTKNLMFDLVLNTCFHRLKFKNLSLSD